MRQPSRYRCGLLTKTHRFLGDGMEAVGGVLRIRTPQLAGRQGFDVVHPRDCDNAVPALENHPGNFAVEIGLVLDGGGHADGRSFGEAYTALAARKAFGRHGLQ